MRCKEEELLLQEAIINDPTTIAIIGFNNLTAILYFISLYLFIEFDMSIALSKVLYKVAKRDIV